MKKFIGDNVLKRCIYSAFFITYKIKLESLYFFSFKRLGNFFLKRFNLGTDTFLT
jgi:hypothetical protein